MRRGFWAIVDIQGFPYNNLLRGRDHWVDTNRRRLLRAWRYAYPNDLQQPVWLEIHKTKPTVSKEERRRNKAVAKFIRKMEHAHKAAGKSKVVFKKGTKP